MTLDSDPVLAREARADDPAQVPVDLVRDAQAGSRRAFTALWQRYAPLVHSILLTMVSEADAEDLTQDVAVAALCALPDLRNRGSFPAWLCAIARNRGRSALKARTSALTADAEDAHLEDAVAPAVRDSGKPLDVEETLREIRRLPTSYREPLMLRLLLEMTGPEIARQTGMTPGSVRVNLCRGMKELRRRLAGALDAEADKPHFWARRSSARASATLIRATSTDPHD